MPRRYAFFLPSLAGGGAERVMLNLAKSFAEREEPVDLVLAQAEGPYLSQVPSTVRTVDLKAGRVMASLPALVRYLKTEQPRALLSALDHANVIALLAKVFSGSRARVAVSIHNTSSVETANARSLRERLTPLWVRPFYPLANAVIAVSGGVADDFSQVTGFPRRRIEVIYNPVITPDLWVKAEAPLDHPWFAPGEPPVVLGVGRLTKQKDFANLIRAFALVRATRPARLLILGEGEDRPMLEALAGELGLGAVVSLPGFVQNPYAYMRRAGAFVLSSAWEGLPTVLIEALALGTPVVSTDCPSGPLEVLEGGKYGALVPLADPQALGRAILQALDKPRGVAQEAYAGYLQSNVVDQYLRVLKGA